MIGKKFKLSGRTGSWIVVKEYTMLGGTLPCVVGISECGRYRTNIRVVDMEEV